MSTLTIQGPRSVTEARAAAARLPEGTQDRLVAELVADGLEFIRRAAGLRPKAAAVCSKIEALKHGVPNPDRPFLKGTCCDEHGTLQQTRHQLVTRAAGLGFENLVFDVNSLVTV